MPTPEYWGRLGALAVHAAGKTNTGPAIRANRDRFLAIVDPDGVLPVEERERRARYAQREFMARISIKGVEARQRKRRNAKTGGS